jgi:hypothetical protein
MAEFTFDLDSLTIEEIELIEDLTDLAIDELLKPGVKKGKVLRAFAYVQNRRTNPDFTLEEAGKLRVSEEEETPLGDETQGEESKDL